MLGGLTVLHISLTFLKMSSIPCMFGQQSLRLGCLTNFDPLFRVMGFNSLFDEIKFLLISSRHFCCRSIHYAKQLSPLNVYFGDLF